MQITIVGTNGINVHLGGRGWNVLGGFHLKIIAFKEEPSDFVNHPCAEPQMILPVSHPFLFFWIKIIL
jgi:hypothetical protein